MKRFKIRYAVGILIIGFILLFIYIDTYKLDLKLEGYGFYQDVDGGASNFKTKPVEVTIDAYVNDSNLNNELIEISYDDIKINENMLLGSKEDGIWSGFIIKQDIVYDDVEILGKIVLFNKGKECFIHLYNEDLEIIAPVDDINIAKQKYLDFKKRHLHDRVGGN